MTAWLNRVLFATLTKGWNSAEIEAYSKAVQHPFDNMPALSTAFQNLDGKATGLLTHASMMIAGLGLIAPMLIKNAVAEGIVIFQILVYLLVAMGCLRCLSLFHSYSQIASDEDYKQHLDRELIIRREIYAICNQVSIAFTVFVFLSLPVLWWWKP
jgi:hypothetical protein